VVGGSDPAEFARATRGRIAHVHLKDVDPAVLARVRSQELTV
jgi:inosose dehydratase